MFIKIMMDSRKTDPRLYRDECLAWLLTQHFGLSPTQAPSPSLRWRLAKPVWKMDPTKAYQSNLLQADQERRTHIQKASPYTLFQCEFPVLVLIRVLERGSDRSAFVCLHGTRWGDEEGKRDGKVWERETVCKRMPLLLTTVSLG